MILNHVWGLFAHPEEEWKKVRKERSSIAKSFLSHVLLLAAIPAVAGYFGTTKVGWRIAGSEVTRLTHESALTIAIISYVTMLVAVLSIGTLIHWMGQTYGSKQPLSQCIALSTHTATPLFVIGIMMLYPIWWLNFIIGLPALAYTVYLLYTGLPIMMGISKERGFLFSSAVLAVGLVMLVGLLAATVILWSVGAGPALTF